MKIADNYEQNAFSSYGWLCPANANGERHSGPSFKRFFFFLAEDGIRDGTVTGVQTCALPILVGRLPGLLLDPSSCQSWRGTCHLNRAASELGLKHEQIEAHEFGWDPWLSRAAWWWPEKIGRASCRGRVESPG